MENNVLCLHFPVFYVHLVPTQHDGDVVAHTHQVPMPVWNILVCDTGCHVKHDDGTLALDVVAIPEATKLLLACRVPHIESDGPSIGVEHKGMNLHTQSGWRRRRLLVTV